MWPMLLDTPKLECKKDLRKLELEAYSIVVSTFRAQGNLNSKKIQILKDLETVLRISTDRHKAELRRAVNDEKLYTIAKRLSHGECVTSEWLQQSRRMIPLLPRLQHNSNTSGSSYYRILADHILQSSQSILKLYPEPAETKLADSDWDPTATRSTAVASMRKKRNINTKQSTTDQQHHNLENVTSISSKPSSSKVKVAQKDQDIVYLANGYAVSAKCVEIENIKPSEFIRKNEESFSTSPTSANNSSFLKYLIQKYKSQNIDSPSNKIAITNTNNNNNNNINNSLQASQIKEAIASPLKPETITQAIPITAVPLLTTALPPTTAPSIPTLTEYSISSKKSSHDSTSKSGSAGSSSGTSGSSNKNSKLISQIIEANATKAIQQQQQQQQQQKQSHQLPSNQSQQVVLQQLKPVMPMSYPIQAEAATGQLITNGGIPIENNQTNCSDKINEPTNICNSNNTNSTTFNTSINTASTAPVNSLKPTKAIKISSTQILRLNSNASPSVSSTSNPACTITPAAAPLSLNQVPNNLTSTTTPVHNSNSTIVKLTSQPQLNMSPFTRGASNNSSSANSSLSVPAACNGASIVCTTTTPTNANSSASFQLFNPNSSQQLKHFVQLPKSAQKLIILPTNSGQASSHHSNLKPNILAGAQSIQGSILSPVVLENGDVKVVNSNASNKDQSYVSQLNTLQTTGVQKLILCKNFNSENPQNSSANLLNSVNGGQNGQAAKSVKIVSTTPILSNQVNAIVSAATNSPSPSTPSLNSNKPIVFNVSSGLKKASIINKVNISLPHSTAPPSTNQDNSGVLLRQLDGELAKTTPYSNGSSEDQEEIQELPTIIHLPSVGVSDLLTDQEGASSIPAIEIINGSQLKRKRSFSQSFLHADQTTTTINLCDTYLQYINETLEKINFMKLKEEARLELRLLCEKIKDKLEANSYDNMGPLNDDLNLIKELCAESSCEYASTNNSLPITANFIAQGSENSQIKTLNTQNILQAQLLQPQISCFKFDDDLQRPMSDVNSAGLTNTNNTNKRIRLLNFNLVDKLDTVPQAAVVETQPQQLNFDNNNSDKNTAS